MQTFGRLPSPAARWSATLRSPKRDPHALNAVPDPQLDISPTRIAATIGITTDTGADQQFTDAYDVPTELTAVFLHFSMGCLR